MVRKIITVTLAAAFIGGYAAFIPQNSNYVLSEVSAANNTRKKTASKVSIKKVKISGFKQRKNYTGKKVRQTSLKLTYKGKTLKNGKDYIVKYKNNTNLGVATVIIKGKGKYNSYVSKKFRIARIGWRTIKGCKYYYNKYGKKVKGIQKIGKYNYYFDKNGVLQTGWQIKDGSYIFFNRKNGRQLKNTTADGIKLSKSGKAADTKYNKNKITTLLKAHNVVKSITKPTDSKATKRLKCFNWILSFPYHQFRQLKTMYNTNDWEVVFANDIFDFKCGDCVSESAALAFLFKEIGYEDVAVCHDTSHSWVTIGNRIFDPVFAEAKSFEMNYNVIPNDYRINPFRKRMI